MALGWGPFEPPLEPTLAPHWRDTPTSTAATSGWNLLNPADSQSLSLPIDPVSPQLGAGAHQRRAS